MAFWQDVVQIDIIAGREALWGVRNHNLIPLGGLVQFRNATLEDNTWRTGGGASLLGTAIGATKILAGIDYWPTTGQQRTVVACDNGKLYKDDGAGGGWVELRTGLTGLTNGSANPFFCIAGSEATGRNRKLFYCDGASIPSYLDADAASMTLFNTSTESAADWGAGANQPAFFLLHDGFLWAGGCPSTPHILYRCTARSNHVDFRSATTYSFPIYSGESERLAGGLSYKTGMLLWKYPDFVYFFDTANTSDTAWRAYKAGQPGMSGPWNATLAEDDVAWVAPDGALHLISATDAAGSVKASGITYRKLGSWTRDQINRDRLNTAHIVYYSDKQEVELACCPAGQTTKSMRLHMDIGRREEVGERWIHWDRDQNEALFLRKVAGVQTPTFGDAAGQLWTLDRAERSKNGAGYTFEWFTKSSDFSEVVAQWAGRKKNGKYFKMEFDPRSTGSHTVEVWRDGVLRQTINVEIETNAPVIPVVIPFTLGVDALDDTKFYKLNGRGTRWAFRGYSSSPGLDVSVTRVHLGMMLSSG